MMCSPLDMGALHHFSCSLSIFVECCLFGNFDAASNIMFTLILLLRLLISGPIINEKYLEIPKILESVCYIAADFLYFNILSMLKFYIVFKCAQLAKLVKTETLNLFNGMDEGLVVVSAVDKSITFASAPAVKLLRQLPRSES